MEKSEVVTMGNGSSDNGTVARELCGCVYYLKLQAQGQMKE